MTNANNWAARPTEIGLRSFIGVHTARAVVVTAARLTLREPCARRGLASLQQEGLERGEDGCRFAFWIVLLLLVFLLLFFIVVHNHFGLRESGRDDTRNRAKNGSAADGRPGVIAQWRKHINL